MSGLDAGCDGPDARIARLNLQSQYDIAVVEREQGAEIARSCGRRMPRSIYAALAAAAGGAGSGAMREPPMNSAAIAAARQSSPEMMNASR